MITNLANKRTIVFFLFIIAVSLLPIGTIFNLFHSDNDTHYSIIRNINPFTALYSLSFGISLAYLALKPFRYRGKVVSFCHFLMANINEDLYKKNSNGQAIKDDKGKYIYKCSDEYKSLHNIIVYLGHDKSASLMSENNFQYMLCDSPDAVYFNNTGAVRTIAKIDNDNGQITYNEIIEPTLPNSKWWDILKLFIDNIDTKVAVFSCAIQLYVLITIAYAQLFKVTPLTIYIFDLLYLLQPILWVIAILPLIIISGFIIYGRHIVENLMHDIHCVYWRIRKKELDKMDEELREMENSFSR